MDRNEILSHVDHTLLKPEATWPQIQTLCDEAVEYGAASVCINTCYVKQAAGYLAGRCKVCCVVGFPLGAMDTASKAFEARTAIANGAGGISTVEDMEKFLELGADRLGTSRAVKLLKGEAAQGY